MATEKRVRLNHEIRDPEIRLIGAEGEQLGVVSSKDAMFKAREAGLDLVEVSPNAEPPVCRIMDFGKYVYEQKKKKNTAKKKQVQVQIKELKYSVTIEEADYQVKLRNLIRFLEHGDKVKVSLRFRGREMTHQDLGMEVMLRIQKDVESVGVVEQLPKLDGRQIMMLVVPQKSK